MKKVYLLLLAAGMFTFVACNEGGDAAEATEETTETPAEEAPAEEAPTEATEETTTSVNWDEFLDDYENYVDQYISIMKKVKADPTDMSVITESANLTQDALKWQEKMEGLTVGTDGFTPEHYKRLNALALKVSKAAY